MGGASAMAEYNHMAQWLELKISKGNAADSGIDST